MMSVTKKFGALRRPHVVTPHSSSWSGCELTGRMPKDRIPVARMSNQSSGSLGAPLGSWIRSTLGLVAPREKTSTRADRIPPFDNVNIGEDTLLSPVEAIAAIHPNWAVRDC